MRFSEAETYEFPEESPEQETYKVSPDHTQAAPHSSEARLTMDTQVPPRCLPHYPPPNSYL